MKNIDIMIDDIIKKHMVDRYNKGYCEAREKIREAENIIDQLFSSISGNIAIYPAGEHTLRVLKQLSMKNYKKVTVLIDKTKIAEKEYPWDIPTVTLEEMNFENVKTVIISTFQNKSILRHTLNSMNLGVLVIDLYEYFEMNNLYFQNYFYYQDIIDYRHITNMRYSYKHSENTEMKEKYLAKIIFGYICVRDFIGGQKYIEEYIKLDFKYAINYKNFLIDLNKILKFIKGQMVGRKERDIILNWVDAIGYDEIDKIPFIKSKTDKTLFFENAFTVTPWTSHTMRTIFSGEKTIDNRIHRKALIGAVPGEYSLQDFLVEKKYKVTILGYQEHEFANIHRYKDRMFQYIPYVPHASLPLMQWTVIKELILNQEKQVFIIHNCHETHAPFINPNMDKLVYYSELSEETEDKECNEQILESCLFVSQQLEWYNQLMPQNATKVYLSDHGRMAKYDYEEKKIHTFFFIEDIRFEPKKFDGLFSYVNFPQLIKKLILEQKFDWEELFNESVDIQVLDRYNNEFIDKLVDKQDYKLWMQAIGVRSATEKYLRYPNGEELYFILPDETHNLVKNPMYENQVEKLRNSISNKYINIFTDDKFQATRELYKQINLSESIFGDRKN